MPRPSWPELHGALTHFPVALLMTACVYEIAALVLKKPEWRVVSFWVLVGAVVMAVPALITGWIAGNTLYGHASTLPRIVVWHRAIAFTTTGIALALLAWRIKARDALEGRAVLAAIGLVLLASAAVGFTGYLGGQMVFGGQEQPDSATGSPAVSLTVPVAVQADPKLVATGATLFLSEQCEGCHKMQGKGAALAPDLTHEARRHADVAWQVAHLQHPDHVHPGSTMPSYARLKPAQLKALAAYLVTRN